MRCMKQKCVVQTSAGKLRRHEQEEGTAKKAVLPLFPSTCFSLPVVSWSCNSCPCLSRHFIPLVRKQCDQTLRFSAKPAHFKGLLRKICKILI